MDLHSLAFLALVSVTPIMLLLIGLRYFMLKGKESPRGRLIRLVGGLLVAVTFAFKNAARAADAHYVVDTASMLFFFGSVLLWITVLETIARRADRVLYSSPPRLSGTSSAESEGRA